jgi:hypothetical protein
VKNKLFEVKVGLEQESSDNLGKIEEFTKSLQTFKTEIVEVNKRLEDHSASIATLRLDHVSQAWELESQCVALRSILSQNQI